MQAAAQRCKDNQEIFDDVPAQNSSFDSETYLSLHEDSFFAELLDGACPPPSSIAHAIVASNEQGVVLNVELARRKIAQYLSRRVTMWDAMITSVDPKRRTPRGNLLSNFVRFASKGNKDCISIVNTTGLGGPTLSTSYKRWTQVPAADITEQKLPDGKIVQVCSRLLYILFTAVHLNS